MPSSWTRCERGAASQHAPRVRRRSELADRSDRPRDLLRRLGCRASPMDRSRRRPPVAAILLGRRGRCDRPDRRPHLLRRRRVAAVRARDGPRRRARPEQAAPGRRTSAASDRRGSRAPRPGDAAAPADPRRAQRPGLPAHEAGRYDEAIPVLQRAVAAFPEGSTDLTLAYALYNLGRSLRLAGRPDEAIPNLERRLRFNNQRGVVRNASWPRPGAPRERLVLQHRPRNRFVRSSRGLAIMLASPSSTIDALVHEQRRGRRRRARSPSRG